MSVDPEWKSPHSERIIAKSLVQPGSLSGSRRVMRNFATIYQTEWGAGSGQWRPRRTFTRTCTESMNSCDPIGSGVQSFGTQKQAQHSRQSGFDDECKGDTARAARVFDRMLARHLDRSPGYQDNEPHGIIPSNSVPATRVVTCQASRCKSHMWLSGQVV